MHSPKERGSSQIVAEDGHAALAKVEEEWTVTIMGVIVDLEGKELIKFAISCRQTTCWVMSHPKDHLEQRLKDLFLQTR